MKKLVVANWKLNPGDLGSARRLLRRVAPATGRSRAGVVFCPPTPYIAPLKTEFPRLVFGAQDAFHMNAGPYTGAIGPDALKSVGARFVILGHSERRAVFGEKDAHVEKKLAAVLASGLTAILCVGEPLAVRRKGKAEARRFVKRQIEAVTRDLPGTSRLLIAYEPVWAISTSGSGQTETPEDAAEMIRFIKKARKANVLYGGSVSSGNISGFSAYKEIDGFLVGGASLKPEDFSAVIGAV